MLLDKAYLFQGTGKATEERIREIAAEESHSAHGERDPRSYG
jgi:hypothetical protein